MGRNLRTSVMVDALLNTVMVGGLVATTLVAPNALQVLDKPLKVYFKKMDKRSREREYQRLLRYMKQQGLIKYTTEDYEHGIYLTAKGRKRAAQTELNKLEIKKPKEWDGCWRLVIFDIPETRKLGRDSFARKLKELGFVQLQRSVWIYPFACKEEIAIVAYQYEVRRYVTYLEAGYIDSQDKLKERFKFNF